MSDPALPGQDPVPALACFDLSVDARRQASGGFQLVIQILGEKIPDHGSEFKSLRRQSDKHRVPDVLANQCNL
jgi:hypothetical protein